MRSKKQTHIDKLRATTTVCVSNADELGSYLYNLTDAFWELAERVEALESQVWAAEKLISIERNAREQLSFKFRQDANGLHYETNDGPKCEKCGIAPYLGELPQFITGKLQELTNRVAAGELTAGEAFEILVRAKKADR